MRSPAETRARQRFERALRLVGILAIVVWIVSALAPSPRARAVASMEALADELPRWTRDAGVDEVRLRVDWMLDATSSAWMTALRRAGTSVTWSADSLKPIAVETWAATDPAGGTLLLVAADGGVLRDDLGPIDTLRRGGITSVRLAAVEAGITLVSGAHRAYARVATPPATDSAEPKALYLAGSGGWEAKFVMAALEEAGWAVDARLLVAPGHEIVQGSPRSGPDTARHAAVILLDSTAVRIVAGVEAFVRAGGGVVLAGDANRAPRVAGLTSWRASAREQAPLGTMAGDTSWRGLSRVPLAARPGSAVTLEQRGGAATVLARRHYAGRVAGVGYDATWRWRMAGGEASVGEHRTWWSRLVSSVAARRQEVDGSSSGGAPVAALHAALGPPSRPGATTAAGRPGNTLAHLLGVIAMAALLGEWVLRRARGGS